MYGEINELDGINFICLVLFRFFHTSVERLSNQLHFEPCRYYIFRELAFHGLFRKKNSLDCASLLCVITKEHRVK